MCPMIRRTRQSEAVRQAFVRAGRPLSPAEAHEAALGDAPTLGVSTVYRAIRRLVEDGVLAPVHLPGEPDRYETAAAAAVRHHHFRCESCERVFDLPAGCFEVIGNDPTGFSIRECTLVLDGVCDECNGRVG